MPPRELGDLSTIYGQQDYINELGKTLFTDQGRAPSILASELHVEDLQLEQLAQLMTRTTDLLSQVNALENGIADLQKKYDYAAKLESR